MSSNSLRITAVEHPPAVEKPASSWQWLYKLGGVAALISLFFIPVSIVVYIVWPPPDTVIGHFAAFQDSLWVGLLGMDLLYLLTNLLLIPTWLALYVALRRTNESLTAVALTLGLMGIITLIIARPIIEMYALSTQYAIVTTEIEQAITLGAAKALLAIYHGTAFNLHYLLGTIGLLIFAFIMLPSPLFDQKTAYVGIAANIITLGYYVPVVGIYISIFSVLFYFVWYLLIARRLLQLGRG